MVIGLQGDHALEAPLAIYAVQNAFIFLTPNGQVHMEGVRNVES